MKGRKLYCLGKNVLRMWRLPPPLLRLENGFFFIKLELDQSPRRTQILTSHPGVGGRSAGWLTACSGFGIEMWTITQWDNNGGSIERLFNEVVF